MTRNQIAALEAQEAKRHNAENEKIDKLQLIPAIGSAVGSVIRGIGAFKGKPQSKSFAGRRKW